VAECKCTLKDVLSKVLVGEQRNRVLERLDSETSDDATLNPRGFLNHMHVEEMYVFAHLPIELRRQLFADHDRYRIVIRNAGKIPKDDMDRHTSNEMSAFKLVIGGVPPSVNAGLTGVKKRQIKKTITGRRIP
jgi:hypothetical protein